jgi:predicted DsbA family dithiol-disulfide isomerase
VRNDINVDVSWEPYLLKESGPYAVPPEGRPILPVGAEPQFHKFADRARAVGIDMTGDVTRVPNTRLSHILLEWAHEQRPEGQHYLKELIFQAYYSKNIYLGDIENLVSLARQAGYDADAARAHLASGKGEEPMVRKANAAKNSGVSGIPYFIVNDKVTFSGAQDPASFKDILRKASRS